MSEPQQGLIGTSGAIRGIETEIQYASRSDAKVLVTGESGVGKEVIARIIHQRSRRAHTPLVTINCAGIPDSLLESALFGHVRGSFTGAHRDRMGLLEMAQGGTLFLDEVCEMSLRMQALLLRFVETGEIQRVGSDRMEAALDVRIIAATNRKPLTQIASKAFREDLYYRLNVIHIAIPPLRDRREDIPVFLHFFLNQYAERHGVAAPELGADALAELVGYTWPGNVRQLRNVAERLVLRGGSGPIAAADLPADVQHAERRTGIARSSAADQLYTRLTVQRESFWATVYPVFMARDLTRRDLRAIVKKGLEQTGGNYKLLVQLFNMDPSDYKPFLNFLRKHDCHIPTGRAARLRVRIEPSEPKLEV